MCNINDSFINSNNNCYSLFLKKNKYEREKYRMKFFKIKLKFKNKSKIEFVAAKDELEAIDICMKKYGEENVYDVEVV